MAIQLKQFHTSTHDTQPKPPFSTTTTHHRLSSLQVNAVSGKAQQLIQSGTVRPIRPKDAASAMESEGYILLDIRPEWEREKARVKGSLHVPLFVKDMDNSLLTLLKKWVHFGYIGLWTGQNFTMINPEFVEKVEMEVPDKDTKLLVACGEGLREYREHVKDLSCLSKQFSRVVIVDNNPFSFLLQPMNGIPCVPFSAEQPQDDQLLEVILPFLKQLSLQKDVQPVLYETFHMPEWFQLHGIPASNLRVRDKH